MFIGLVLPLLPLPMPLGTEGGTEQRSSAPDGAWAGDRAELVTILFLVHPVPLRFSIITLILHTI